MHTTKDDVRSLAPAYQHALILTMRDILENRPGQSSEPAKKIQCFAQDPLYSEADEAVLGNAGITVLRDPRAFLEVDDQSLVISFAPNVPVRQIIADIARPAVMIWDRVMSEAEAAAFWGAIIDDDDDDDGFHPGRTTDPESRRVRDMVRDQYHEPIAMGPKKAFGNSVVYVRRE